MRGTVRAAVLSLAVLALLSSGSRAADRSAINEAIEKGVQALRRMQDPNDGIWPYNQEQRNQGYISGITALAAFTLLECGVKPDDPAIEKAAKVVRASSPGMTQTYSLSLAIMFLDRLNDSRDVALIESLTVRLLAGQGSDGGWTYSCPPIAVSEADRLSKLIQSRNELKGGRDLPKPGKKRFNELPPQIQRQLMSIH